MRRRGIGATYVVSFSDRVDAARFGRGVAEDYLLDVTVDACLVSFLVPDGVLCSPDEVERRALADGGMVGR